MVYKKGAYSSQSQDRMGKGYLGRGMGSALPWQYASINLGDGASKGWEVCICFAVVFKYEKAFLRIHDVTFKCFVHLFRVSRLALDLLLYRDEAFIRWFMCCSFACTVEFLIVIRNQGCASTGVISPLSCTATRRGYLLNYVFWKDDRFLNLSSLLIIMK